MRFANWPFLLLILLIPLLHQWWVRRNKPARVRYSLPIPKEISAKSSLLWVLGIKYLGLILLVVAMARPQSSTYQVERTVSGVDIMMLLDVSASMQIEDLAEDRSRLDIAKDTFEKFIGGRQNDRIGFVMFSGEPLTMAPPTLDYGLLLRSLHQASTGILRDGTAIGDGLALAVNYLRSSKAKSKVVILLTDGDNNLGQVDPLTAGELAVGYGVRVYSIAIGREGRVKLPIRHKSVFGNVVTTYQWMDNALNPELLQKISEKTHGRFYRVTDERTLGKVFDEIDHLEKTEIKTQERVRYDEEYQKPLKVGVLLLLIGLLLERGVWRFLP